MLQHDRLAPEDSQQEEFVDRWTMFLKLTREIRDGFEGARLVADEENPRHSLSVGEWRDSLVRQAWADEPRFLCLEACDECRAVRRGQNDLLTLERRSVTGPRSEG
jgi:heme-degrading monooxygenase HmoA